MQVARPLEKIRSVLSVSNTEGVHQILRDLSASREINVISAQSAEDACDVLAENDIDLVVTNLDLPKMDGVELMQWCRLHSMHMPVVVVTPEDKATERQKLVTGDCCGFIVAGPVSASKMDAAIELADQRDHRLECSFEGASAH